MHSVTRLILPTAAALAVFALAPASAAAIDYDCADFQYQEEAQEHLLPGDPYHLDGDHDGIACEDLPHRPEPPRPPEEKLSKNVARQAAMRTARKFVRRRSRLKTVNFKGCRRKSPQRVDCRFVSRGETARRQFRCRFKVSVEGTDASHSTRAKQVICRSTPR